jgi:uncharacterized membrane protein YkvA (DUF1232 family)
MAKKDPLVARMPVQVQDTFTRLLDGGGDRDAEVLRMALDRYLDVIEEQAKSKKHIDLELARKITRSCNKLLDFLAEADEDQHRKIFAAVEYFLLPADGDDDLAVPEGLDDDAAVVSEVARDIDREDLIVYVPDRSRAR